MSSIGVALDALDAAVELLGAADVRELPAAERFVAVDRLETALRRQIAVSRDQLRHLEQYQGCPPVDVVLADMLRISRREAKRRLRDAEQLGPRTTLTGQELPPLLAATAKAWEAGLLDVEHLRVIQKFVGELPDHVSAVEVEKAERSLAEHAQNLRPDQLEKVAHRLATHLNPDGKFSEQDRARKRGFVWCGGQRVDGMSVGKSPPRPNCGPCWMRGWRSSPPPACATPTVATRSGICAGMVSASTTRWLSWSAAGWGTRSWAGTTGFR